jgi:hypothetical protein
MTKREFITELKRRIKFLEDLIPCKKHCTGGHPAISGKILAYRNILRLAQSLDLRKK